MSVLDVLFPKELGSQDPITNPALWSGGFDSGLFSSSGAHVTGTTSKTLSAYYGCLRAISEDVAKLPFKVYKHVEGKNGKMGGKELQRNHDVFRLLNVAPNPRHTAMTVREMITHWCLGHGNGYAEIEMTPRPSIEALHPIHPDRVAVLAADGGGLEYEVRDEDGSKRIIPQARMLHLRGLGGENMGYSVFRFAVESLGRALAVQTSSAAFFKNGSRLGAVLEHPGELSEKAQKRLRSSFNERYSGVGNTGGTFIAEEGMKYKAVGIPPEEAQMIETSLFMVVDVCRWFRMPPHKVQHLADATFSNIESQAIEYVCDTLEPWLIRWEQEVNRKLFPEGSDLFAEHVVAALLRGDQAARSAFYDIMSRIGVFSINEIRALENMNPIENGDEHMVQLNMTEASEDEDDGDDDDDDVKAALPPPPVQSDADKAKAIAEAHRPIFAATIDRMDRAQKTAADRALKRIGDDKQARAVWAIDFYREQARKYDAATGPCVASLFAAIRLAGGDTSALDGRTVGHALCFPRQEAVIASRAIEYGMGDAFMGWLLDHDFLT